MLEEDISCKIDLRNEKIGYKIREHSTAKIPFIFVIGESEVENKTISLRRLGSKEIENYSIKKILNFIKNEKNKY